MSIDTEVKALILARKHTLEVCLAEAGTVLEAANVVRKDALIALLKNEITGLESALRAHDQVSLMLIIKNIRGFS